MRILIPILLFFVSITPLMAQTAAQEKGNEAAQLMRDGDYKDAAQVWGVMIELAEDKELIKFGHIYRGQCYKMMGEYDKAISDINTAIEMDPADIDSYFDRIHIYKGMQNWAAVLADANLILKKKPTAEQESIAHYYKGLALLNTAEPKKALKSLAIAEKYRPDDAELLLYIGKAHEDLRDFEKAIDYYSKMISASPDWAMGYYSRGNARLLKFRAENNDIVVSVMVRDACEDLKRAKELNFQPAELIDEMLGLYCN